MGRFAFALLPALLLVLSGSMPGSGAAAPCPGTNGHVWFLGISYDSAERGDFKHDVTSFEKIRTELRDIYCIPASQTDILAFDGNFSIGVTNYTNYTPATEANLKSTLASFATAANAHTDSILFFFHSSHGNVYSYPLSPCGPLRTYGSFSALGGGGGQDGTLYDCELGAALSAFDPDVRMMVAVDCSFCGGFSDSLTAASGTVPDGAPVSSGVPGANRVVMTGCAMTTECFGGGQYGGSVFYDNLYYVTTVGKGPCDGWTAPGFPTVQGLDVPVPTGTKDNRCTASEWFFRATIEGYLDTSPVQPIAYEQQYRIKYGSSFTDLEVID